MFTRKLAVSALLIGVTAFAFASIGGGKNKSANKKLTSGYSAIRTSRGFSLKSGLPYNYSAIYSVDRSKNNLSFNSLVSYRNGNLTYILPNKYKISTACRSNLQVLNLKINLGK